MTNEIIKTQKKRENESRAALERDAGVVTRSEKIKENTALFIKFIKLYGQNFNKRLVVLGIGSVIQTFSELIGIALVFPLMALIANPEAAAERAPLRMFSEFIGVSNPSTLVLIITVIIGIFYIARTVFALFFENMQLQLILDWQAELSNKMMAKYLSIPYLWHVSKQPSELINGIMGILPSILTLFVQNYISLATNIIVAIIMFGATIAFFPIQTLVSMGLLGFMVWGLYSYIKKMTEKVNRIYEKSNADTMSVLTQGLSGIRETKMMLSESQFYKQFSKVNYERLWISKRLGMANRLPGNLTEVAIIIAMLVFAQLTFTVSGTREDALASAAVMMLIAFRIIPITNRSLFCLTNISASSIMTKNFIDKGEELEEIAMECDPTLDGKDNIEPAHLRYSLALQDVSFQYEHGGVNALHDVDLEIKKGEFIGIIGSSGAGKTTLCSILTGLLRPDSGNVLIDGNAVDVDDLRRFRRRVGYVHQISFFLNSTIRENVAYGVKEEDIDDTMVHEALEKAQLADVIKRHPLGIEMPIGENGIALSGGQRQRLAIARALYHSPEVILLDEATSALDLETEKMITDAIDVFRGEVTIVAVAHRISTLKTCDRLVLMRDGRVERIGTWSSLYEESEEFRRLIELLRTDSTILLDKQRES